MRAMNTRDGFRMGFDYARAGHTRTSRGTPRDHPGVLGRGVVRGWDLAQFPQVHTSMFAGDLPVVHVFTDAGPLFRYGFQLP
jgi:hypothetical protein